MNGTGNSRSVDVPSVQQIALSADSGKSKTHAKYIAHWAAADYADSYISDALDGDGRFIDATTPARTAAVWRGVQLQTTWMAVIREAETAVSECHLSSPTALAKLDRAWSYYAGSLEGTDGTGSGVQIMALAEEVGAAFGTEGTTLQDTVNTAALALFQSAQRLIENGQCDEAETIVDRILSQATIPLLQGTIHYAELAHRVRRGEQLSRDGTILADETELRAVAWTFATAVVPLVELCNTTSSDILIQELAFDAPSPLQGGAARVAEALQATYSCLAVTCADVGGHLSGDVYTTGLAPCGAVVPPPPAPLDARLHLNDAEVQGSDVHSDDGLRITLTVAGVGVTLPEGPVRVEVRWEGGQVLQGTGSNCGDVPCVTLVWGSFILFC